ncbi:hypothetical protein D6783_01650 [Candidatus Woesearchaeota archaeon]|nr:MAG: hypothetical protein D6783_01650 [Candidatus Woesearchaeota archaeon]
MIGERTRKERVRRAGARSVLVARRLDRRLGAFALLVLLSALLFCAVAEDALALGIAPARTRIDFAPGLEKELTYRVINNDKVDFHAIIFAEGELKDSIRIEKPLIALSQDEGEKTFTVKVRLPDEAPSPGQHVGKVVLLHVPEDYFDEEGVFVLTQDQGLLFNTRTETSQVTATAGVASQIIVNVPYPGTYAKAKLHVSEGGVDSPVVFTISVFNFGTERIEDAYARVRILGANNEEIVELRSNMISLDAKEEGKVVASWEGKHNPGAYYAEVFLEYSDEVEKLGEAFTIGRKFIRIKGLDIRSFRLGEIAKLDFTVESDWNEPIENVEGEVNVIDDSGSELSTFSTVPTRVRPHKEEVVTAYWDTQGLVPGEYDVNLDLLYDGASSSRLFETVLSLDEAVVKGGGVSGRVVGVEEKGGSSYNVLVLLVAVLIVMNIVLFFSIRRKK